MGQESFVAGHGLRDVHGIGVRLKEVTNFPVQALEHALKSKNVHIVILKIDNWFTLMLTTSNRQVHFPAQECYRIV